MVQSSSPITHTAVEPPTASPEETSGSSLPSDTSDEIMDLLVQSVTKSSPRALAARERKRSRGNRKSCECPFTGPLTAPLNPLMRPPLIPETCNHALSLQ